jgi:hypothetical protein
MKTSNNTNSYIRQQQNGQFRLPENGKGPYVHANGQKLDNTLEQKNVSIYVENETVFSSEKGLKSDFPKLFDSDAGVKFETIEAKKPQNKGESYQGYENTGNERPANKQDSIINEWV